MFHENNFQRKATEAAKSMAQQERIIKATRDMKTEDMDQQQAVRRQRPLLRAPDSAEVSRSQISIDAIYPGPMALYEKYNSIAQKTASIKTFGSLNQSRHQENQLAQRDEFQHAENANQIENEDQGHKLQ